MADDGWDVHEAITTATPTSAPVSHGADDDGWDTHDAIGAPAAPTTSAYEAAGGRTTWGDTLQAGVAGLHSAAATAAGAVASTSDAPQEAYWRDIAKRQAQAAGESEKAMTPAAQAPGFFKHPLVSTVEAIPGIATIGVPAAVATGVAGPVAGAAVAGGLMGLQTRGDVYNRLTGEGIEPTSEQLAGATALGVATGLATEPVGALVGKAAVNPLVKWGLGLAGDATTFGASSGAQEYSTEKAEIAAGKRAEIDPSAVLSATKEGAEQGAGFKFFHSGAHRDPTQTGGKATVPRTPDAQVATESKERAKTIPPKDQAAAGPATPSSPVADPTIKAGTKEAPIPTPGKVTPASKPQDETVQQPPSVVQPTPPPSQTATEAPQTADTTGPPSPPPPAQQASPAPAAAPPAPVDPALLAQHHAELIDPNHPRDAVIVPKGVQVPDITTEKWRYGKAKLPGDGGTVLYDHSRGSNWTKDKIKDAAADGTLQDKIDAQASKPSVVEAPTAAAGKPEGVPPVAAAEAAPDPTQARIDAIKAQAAARRAELDAAERGEFKQPQDVQPKDVQPTGASQAREEVTLESDPLAGATKLAENKAGVAIYRDKDGQLWKAGLGNDVRKVSEETAKIIFPKEFGGEGYVPQKSEAETIREAADTEAARLKLAREKVATLSTKDEETGEELAKPLPEAGARVLRAEDEGERERAATQAEVDRKAAEKVATEQPTAKVVKPKEEQKPSKDRKRNEAQAANNKIAGEVVDRHPPKDIEANAIDPSKEGGKGARAALISRLKEMLEDAKTSKYEMLEKAKHRVDPEARHSNKALILYEAKLLLGRGAKAKTEDYMRFLHNEHLLLTGGAEAYDEVMGLRKQTGRETAAERGKGVKETGVEDVEATKGTEAEETADEAHERELTKALEAKRTVGEQLKEKAAKEREEREAEAKRQAELKAEADRVKRSLPAEPEIISPARAKLMDADKAARERIAKQEAPGRPGATETSPGVWRATIDGNVLGDSKGYRSRSDAMDEAEHIANENRIAKEAREGKDEEADYRPAKQAVGFKVEKRRFDPKAKPKIDKIRDEVEDARTPEEIREANREFFRNNLGMTDEQLDAMEKEQERILAKIDAGKTPTPEEEKILQVPNREENPSHINIELENGKWLQLKVRRSSNIRDMLNEIADEVRQSGFATGDLAHDFLKRVIDLVGDVKVRYLSKAELNRVIAADDGISEAQARLTRVGGFYNYDTHQIVINDQIPLHQFTVQAKFHEAIHAATSLAMERYPEFRQAIREIMDAAYWHTDADTLGGTSYAFTNEQEFVAEAFANPKLREYLAEKSIPAALKKQIDYAAWRKLTGFKRAIKTMWDLTALAIGKFLKLPPRGISYLEATLAHTETFMEKHAKDVAEGVPIKYAPKADYIRSPEKDQETFLRTPMQSLSRVRNIDRQVATQFGKDKFTNLSAKLMHGSMKILSGTWMNDVHGHLFTDQHGPILQAINRVRDAVHHAYSQLMDSDKDIINRGYMLDRTYASHMGDYARLVDLSNTHNIHADRAAPSVKGDPADEAQRNWQRNEHYPEARAIYDRLPEQLQKRYRDEKRFYMDKQGQTASIIVNKILPLFAPPKGSTLDEVMGRARNNNLTEDDWDHYEKLKVDGALRRATRLMNKRDVYFNAQRDGRFGVSGHYEMPAGGSEKTYSGEDLPENKREFDNEKDAHAFVTGTHMHATTREIHYWTDTGTGKTIQVGHDFASSAPGHETIKYQVGLETQNTQFATTPAEALRNRQAMEASGVRRLTGVFDRRNEEAWSKINSADQKAIERKIASNDSLTDMEKQHMRDISRQMMLAGQGGMSAHIIQARKVAGAKFDTAAGLHAYARAVNFHMAREAHAPELDAAMTRLDEHEKTMEGDSDNSLRRSMVANEMRDRVYGHSNDVLNSKSSPLMHRLMTWAFINFLARPSHIFLSQIHPWIYSVPMMGARHGIWKAGAAQRQAMKDLGGMTHNLWEGAKAGYDVYKSGREKDIDKAVQMAHGVDPIRVMISRLKNADEREFLNKMWQSEHLHSAFDASVFAGDGMDRTNAIVRQFTDAMEANNRLSTALAAYRLEKTMHADKDRALAYSRRVIEESHGVYSPTNTAPLFKNPLLRPMLQFHQQPMNLAMMMYRNMAKAAPKMVGGEANTEARWTLAYQLATAAALGGMGGMPLDVPKMAAIASMPFGGPSPDDWNDMTQRFLADHLGETAANFIQEGLPSLAGQYGPSLGHRAGYDAGFIYGSPNSGSAADMLSFAAKQAVGAGPSMAMDWMDAIHNMFLGNYQQAFEGALPGSLKDIAKAYRLSTQGQTTRAGKQIYPGSVGDTLQQLLGFSSLDRERAQAGHKALYKATQAEKDNKTVTEQLKAKHAAARQKTVLGVSVGKKNRALASEYEGAYGQ